MTATVDKLTCTGCGLCADICPEVFALDNKGLARVRDGRVPEAAEAGCLEAAENCPVDAIQCHGPDAAGCA